jgi:hypothetical protein
MCRKRRFKECPQARFLTHMARSATNPRKAKPFSQKKVDFWKSAE